MNNEIFLWAKIFCIIVFTDWCKSQKDSFIAEVFGLTLTEDTCVSLVFFTQGMKNRIKNILGCVSLVWFPFVNVYVFMYQKAPAKNVLGWE